MILKNYATNDYIKVVKKIKKYNLLGEVNGLDDFIASLNFRQLYNLLKMDILETSDIEVKRLLINKSFLDSKECLNDISFIKLSTKREQRNSLIKVATNPISLKSKHHKHDMYCIYRVHNQKVRNCLVLASTNKISLENKKHADYMSKISFSSDAIAESLTHKLCCEKKVNDKQFNYEMNLISTSNTDEIAHCLGIVSTDYFSIDSKYHNDDMMHVHKADTDKKAIYLTSIATNSLSLNSIYHKLHMDALSNAKDDVTASILFHMIIDEEMQNTLYHEKEINYILNAKTDVHLKYLCNFIFDPMLRKDPLYLSNLDIIANCKDVNHIKTLVKSMLKESDEFEEKYKCNEENSNEFECVAKFTDGEEKEIVPVKKANKN